MDSCVNCPAGRYSSTGQSACSICDEDRFEDSKTQCERCPEGRGPTGFVANMTSATGCAVCNASTYSPSGMCTECADANIVNEARTTCTSCPAGKEPNAAQTACIDCAGNRVSSSGFCEECPTHQVPCIGGLPCTNTSRIACMDCPDRQTGLDGQCVCAPGSYEPSSGIIACYEHGIDAVEPTSTQE
eukprot:COSAG02_NODE_17412_length_1005_cov_46.760486_2_plen_186_part_01